MPLDSLQKLQLVLPFAEREFIDVPRAMRILGVSGTTISRMANANPPQIRWLDYGKNTWKRVHYHSVVEFCDRLRADFNIADRRPLLSAPYLRHRDEDLLPFPISDSINPVQATELSGCPIKTLHKLIDEGAFEAYRLVEGAPWRISMSTFSRYILKLYDGMQPRP